MRFIREISSYWMERAFGFKKWNFLLKAVLFFFSILYVIGGLIRKLLVREFHPEFIKVISVGSPFAGGSGKTTFAIFLTSELLKRGYNAFYLQKTYSFLGFNNEDEFFEAVEVLGRDRVFRAKSVKKFLMEEDRKGNKGIFVLDDGFTNPGLCKALNIAAFDSKVLFGNKMVFPFGPMRVPVSRLKEADLIVLKGKERYEFGKPTIKVEIMPESIIELKTGKRYPPDFLKGKEVIILCGTGNPFSFINTIHSLSAKPIKTVIFPDHYNYSEKEIKEILGREMVITTLKDSKRMPIFPNIYALKVRPYVDEDDLKILMGLISKLNF